MDYSFICPKCEKEETIEMRMSEYTSKGHMCKKCGTELVRNPESFCSNFQVNCDGFFGKSSNH